MSRRRKLRLTPSWLPVIRDHLVEDGRQRAALAKTGGLLPVGELVDSMYGELDGLEAASLWWVNSDMCKVVEAQFRSGELPEPPEYPTTNGFVVYEDGVSCITNLGTMLVNAVAWEATAGRIGLRLYTSDPDTVRRTVLDKRLPICPMDVEVVPTALGVVLDVTMALMREPRVSAVKPCVWRTERDGPRPVSMERQSAKVKMIVLRPGPRSQSSEWAQRSRRRCEYRYFVRGFWRNQAYGPAHSKRRRQWVAPFVRGPEDGPLVIKEAVSVWTHQ